MRRKIRNWCHAFGICSVISISHYVSAVMNSTTSDVCKVAKNFFAFRTARVVTWITLVRSCVLRCADCKVASRSSVGESRRWWRHVAAWRLGTITHTVTGSFNPLAPSSLMTEGPGKFVCVVEYMGYLLLATTCSIVICGHLFFCACRSYAKLQHVIVSVATAPYRDQGRFRNSYKFIEIFATCCSL